MAIKPQTASRQATAQNKQQEQTARPEVTIRGKRYPLRFDLWALEQIEEEFGGVSKMLTNLRGGEGTVMSATIRTVFRIMANCARDYAGLAPNLTGDEVRHTAMGPLTAAIYAAIDRGMKAETSGGGEADDEPYDAYAEEYDEKNV